MQKGSNLRYTVMAVGEFDDEIRRDPRDRVLSWAVFHFAAPN